MLSLRISFDYCDLVKRAGQVFFLVRDEEINSSRGHIPASLGESAVLRPPLSASDRHSSSSWSISLGEGRFSFLPS